MRVSRALFSWCFCMLVSFPTPVLASIANGDGLRIVASFSILGDMVSEVVGDLCTVSTIVGPDADAHIYQPSIADARTVAAADIVFLNGLGFETWLQKLIQQSGTRAAVHVASEGVSPIIVNGTIDPHAWNSVTNATVYVQNISRVLSEAMPEHASIISRRADDYINELLALDAEFSARVSQLPDRYRTVVTAHDAFGYLAVAYDLQFLAPQGIDTLAEPSAADLAALIQQLKRTGAAALFVENVVNPAVMNQIARETGIKVGGRLYSDALSRRGEPAAIYIDLFKHNVGAILDALERSAALAGRQDPTGNHGAR